jgi:hypothetical protein
MHRAMQQRNYLLRWTFIGSRRTVCVQRGIELVTEIHYLQLVASAEGVRADISVCMFLYESRG